MINTNTIAIREMTPNDWESVATIYQQGLDTNMATFQTLCPSYEEWNLGHLKDCRYVAQKDGFLTGWIALFHFTERSLPRCCRSQYLY